MADKEKKDFQWFLVTDDPGTNEIIARELSRLNESAGNDITFIDNEGRERNAWRVRFQVLNTFLKAQKMDKSFRFLPFVKEGNGAYKEWKLPKIKKGSKQLLQAQQQLAEITGKK